MSSIRNRLAFVLLLLVTGCGAADERMLFLRSGAADLPVLVRGSASSETMLLFVHGGPGGSGLVYLSAMRQAFDPISAKYLLATYDQRGAGAAQGNVSGSELNLAQHVKDLGDVVALLRSEYPGVKRLVLMGHSWGGLLTAAYLADPARAAGIAAWIDVDGSTDMPRVLELSREWAMVKAQEKVDAGVDVERWSETLSWYRANPTLGAGNLAPHMANVDALGGTTFDPATASGSSLGALFFSPYSAGADVHNASHSMEVMLDELLTLDLHPAMAAIELPVLLLHGEQDGRVPIALAEEALAALGTAPGKKELVRFARSAHRPFDEEPEAFSSAVIGFVDRL